MSAHENTPDAVLARLHAGLTARRTPQDVAADLVTLGAPGWLPGAAAAELRTLAWGHRSQMPTVWAQHAGLTAPYEVARAALAAVRTATSGGFALPAEADPSSGISLLEWCAQACAILGLTGPIQPATPANGTRVKTYTLPAYSSAGVASHEPDTYSYSYPVRPRGARGEGRGHVNARSALSAEDRRAQLPGCSVRTYRRAVKAVLHLQQRAGVLALRRDLEFATLLGKARLAATLSLEEFAADVPTAAFVAYYTARLGLRTLFTSGAQARPMDSLAEALLEAALASPTCAPRVLAAVLTRQSVLGRLSPGEQGELLGTWFEALSRLARTLESVFDPKRDRTAMTVRRGDDSSTWNAASRAYNQARTGWLNLLVALDLDEDVLVRLLPGKIPALVASDVAYWHHSVGGDTHADLAVWASLPLPWDVLAGRALCTRTQVEEACVQAGLDAATTGWSQPYRQAGLELPEPAPELVHGIAVASPELATLLRSSGAFSGQEFDSEKFLAGLEGLGDSTAESGAQSGPARTVAGG